MTSHSAESAWKIPKVSSHSQDVLYVLPFCEFFICICWGDPLLPVLIYCNLKVSPFLILFEFLFICYRFPWSGRFCLIDIVTVEAFVLVHSGRESVNVSFCWRDLQRCLSWTGWRKKFTFAFLLWAVEAFQSSIFFPRTWNRVIKKSLPNSTVFKTGV